MANPANTLHWLFSRARSEAPRNRLIARWLFLRALGLVYGSAFFALLFQARGLVGTAGILPLDTWLQRVAQAYPGLARVWIAPTILWLAPDNHALMAILWIGLLASILVTLNLATRASLLVCFLSFLSFIAVSQDFGQYQSDGMLLEAGFLALFLAPRGLLPGWGARSLASRAASLLLLWEWFRIYFESGIVKLASGDPTWRNFTAMYEYYQNGPLPTWVGWYLEQLPHWFQQGTAGLTLVMELGLVFLAFIPGRRWRNTCFVIVTLWQIGVIATANYAFLNYLVLILGVLLLDDQTLTRFVPKRWHKGLLTIACPPPLSFRSEAKESASPDESNVATSVIPDEVRNLSISAAPEGGHPERSAQRAVEGPAFSKATEPAWRHHADTLQLAITAVVLTTIFYVSTAQLLLILWPAAPVPLTPVAALEPFRIANQYGLFATMTPHRYEIEFQGSNDGITWTPYPFRYKPQNPVERPRIYAPYQPRFDWNLWFASLGPWQEAPIVILTEQCLLENDPDVLGLFRANPFPQQPPRMIRAVLYQYWFSTREQKRTQHLWWTRQLLGTYAPTLERLPDNRYAVTQAPTLNGPPPD